MIEKRQIVRLAAVTTVLSAGFVGLGMRMTYLHLAPGDALRDKATVSRTVEKPILVGRGRILDRKGSILAMDLTVYDVSADPSMLQSNRLVQSVGGYLARVLALDPAEVREKLGRPDRKQVYIKRGLHEEDMVRLKALKLPHVWFEPVSARYYPQNNLMSHIVGFSNTEGFGSAGMELHLDARLHGVPGRLISQQDGKGREMLDRRILEIPPQAGSDVYLTLDANLQLMTEGALEQAVEKYHAIGAWAIIEDVRTGEILAMASRPDYNLNAYNTAPPERMLNRPIGYVYEPGSTFKIGVIAAALNEHTVSPETVFDCENGCWIYRGRPLHDYHSYGLLNVADVIKKSSNIGAAKIALTLGEERFERYLREFGIGRSTGIELPGEEGGIFWPRAKWDTLSVSRMAMGHSISVTALQMLGVACALGNDGFLMRPAVLRRVTDPHGRTLYEFQPTVVGRPVREDTARLMMRLMTRVTEEGGTGRKAALEGYAVAGKTGTAIKPVAGGYSSSRNIASFVGVVPAEDPRIAIMIVVDEPQVDVHTGGAIAAPVFHGIAQEAVRYLDIPPSGKVKTIDPGTELPDPEPPEETPHAARKTV